VVVTRTSGHDSEFRRLLAPVADAINVTEDIDVLHDALAALRRVESVAEARIVALIVAGSNRQVPDEVFDTGAAAEYLGKSVDWVRHHKQTLLPARVNPPGTRPQFSKNEIHKLRRRWAGRR
jgi:hypothetical protein